MTLKAVEEASNLEGGINQHSSLESRVIALLQFFVEEPQKEVSHEELSPDELELIYSWRTG
jgi:DNA-binding winged helix-turn-helix (wHTH) protein